jgi:hypothetical protein
MEDRATTSDQFLIYLPKTISDRLYGWYIASLINNLPRFTGRVCSVPDCRNGYGMGIIR